MITMRRRGVLPSDWNGEGRWDALWSLFMVCRYDRALPAALEQLALQGSFSWRAASLIARAL